MNNMVISLFFIFFLLFTPFILSAEFEISYPQSVDSGEEFEVTIKTNSTEKQDVKIFVHDDKKEFSEILVQGIWKSTMYYLKEVLPETKEFNLRAHYSGETKICARLRASGGSSYEEVCKNIEVQSVSNSKKQDSNSESKEEEEADEDSMTEDEEEEIQEKETSTKEESKSESIDSSNSSSGTVQSLAVESFQQNSESIILNSPKENIKTSFSSRKSSILIWSVLLLTLFSSFLVLLVIFRKHQ